MALVIEDGTGIAGANSYASVSDFTAYVAERSREVPVLTDPQIEGKLLDAMDVLSTYPFVGVPAVYAQPLDWPRNYRVESLWDTPTPFPFPEDKLKRAQIEIAVDIANGVDPLGTSDGTEGLPIIEDTIGPLTTKYASPGVNNIEQGMKFPRILAILSGIVIQTGGFRNERI